MLMINSPIKAAVEDKGYDRVAKACGVTRRAVIKWVAAGHLPRTEWTGETEYADAIERLTEGKVTRDQLLATRTRKAA